MKALALLTLVALFAPAATSAELKGYEAADPDWRRLEPGMNARQTWAQANMNDYVFILETHCYCPLPRRAKVYVLGDRVVQLEDLEGAKVITDPAILRATPTVTQLFRLMDRLARKQPDRLSFEHDRHLGYPTRVYADPSLRLADDETDYRLRDLKPLRLRSESGMD